MTPDMTNLKNTLANKEKEDAVPKYQHYKSSRTAMRLITVKGKKIIFSGYEFITQDEDIIEYLDYEIKQGLPGIVKGELLTVDEANPMEALRRKHVTEYLEQQKEKKADIAKGISKDMGSNAVNRLNPVSSNQVAN